MINNLKQCYETLGLTTDATSEQIKLAYRDLVKVWHPDRFGSDPRLQSKAQDKLKQINEAYERLSALPDDFDFSSASSSAPKSESKREGESKPGGRDDRTENSVPPPPPRPKATAPPPFSTAEKFSVSEKSEVSSGNFAFWTVLCAFAGLLLIACVQSSEASRTIAMTWTMLCLIIGFIVSKLIPIRSERRVSALPTAFTGAVLGSCFGNLLYDYHSSQLIIDIVSGETLTNAGLGALFKQLFLTLLFSIIFLFIFSFSSKIANQWWLASSLGCLLAVVTLAEQMILPSSQKEIARSLMLQPKETAAAKVEPREATATGSEENADPFGNAGSASRSVRGGRSGAKRSGATVEEQRKAVMQWPPQKNGQKNKEGLFISTLRTVLN